MLWKRKGYGRHRGRKAGEHSECREHGAYGATARPLSGSVRQPVAAAAGFFQTILCTATLPSRPVPHSASGGKMANPLRRYQRTSLSVWSTSDIQPHTSSALVCSAHRDTVDVLSRFLGKWGHVVFSATTLAQAMSIFQGNSIDLIISDLELTDGDGCEFFQQAKALRPVRGIVMSGHGMARDVERCRVAGFSIHLLKPFHIEDLKAAIDAECEKAIGNGQFA